MDAAERELQAAVTALQGRDGRSGRGAFARRIVMKGGRLCGEGADERRIIYYFIIITTWFYDSKNTLCIIRGLR